MRSAARQNEQCSVGHRLVLKSGRAGPVLSAVSTGFSLYIIEECLSVESASLFYNIERHQPPAFGGESLRTDWSKSRIGMLVAARSPGAPSPVCKADAESGARLLGPATVSC